MGIEDSLYRALKKNDREDINRIFTKIYNDYSNLLFYISKQYVSRTEGEDLIQETFLDFYNKLDLNRQIANIKYYLVATLRNKCVTYLKTKPILIEQDENVPYLEETTSYGKEKWERGLNELEKQIIIEHVIVGKKLIEISREMNRSSNTIKSIYRRAIIKAKNNYRR